MMGRIASFSLQQKMSVTLLAVMGVLLLVSWAILRATVTPIFAQLEREAATTNMVRVQRAIQSDLDQLATAVGDWAPWDDSWKYVRGENPGFVKSNLNLTTFANLHLDLLAVFDTEGRMIWGAVPGERALTDPAVLGVFEPGNPDFQKLITHPELDSHVEGLIDTRHGPMLVSSRPIITSAKEGPIAGTMIMGQFFDEERVQRLRQRTEVALEWFRPEAAPEVPGLDEASGGAIVQVASEEFLHAYSVLPDLSGTPLIILQASTARNVSAIGSRSVKGALLSLLIAGLVVAVATWLLLHRIILRPLERLAAHISGIRRSGDLSVSLNESRADEIGALAGEFDRMTHDLHDARRQLLEQSFKAGKADTAAEVLHNIRNALTPLINGIDRVSRNFRSLGALRIPQATEELGNPECPPDRREKLVKYISSAFEHLLVTKQNALEDLDIASRQAHQVEAILADQERFANVAPVMENLHLDEIVQEAALVLPDRDENGVRLNLQGELRRFRVRGHRVGLAQVLGNLILNAYEAIQRGQAKAGSIDVLAGVEQQHDQPMVRVTVRDTGCGFTDADRQRIFQRGFTSKQPSEFAGLGLHWCANSLAAMGGRIVAESTGPGQGAAFHVWLPAA